jgi:predicted phage terminase large subunit-like protein
LPQEFDPDRARTTVIGWRDPRSTEGELLFPERFPAEVLETEKRRLTPYGYSGQHQQSPIPREGAMFQQQWFAMVAEAPATLAVVRYWDKAGAKPGQGDFTVGVLMGRCNDGLFWVLDVVRGQWPPDERNKVILATAEADKARYRSVQIFVEQPPGLGKESTDAVVKLLAGFDVTADPVRGTKEERAEPLSAQCRAGNVRVVRDRSARRWNAEFLSVLCSFPLGAHDDDVDAAAGAFNKLALREQQQVYDHKWFLAEKAKRQGTVRAS